MKTIQIIRVSFEFAEIRIVWERTGKRGWGRRQWRREQTLGVLEREREREREREGDWCCCVAALFD